MQHSKSAQTAPATICQPRLVALDIDGTLLHHRRHIAQEHQDVVHELRQRGITVCLVTGRPHLTTIWPHQALDLDTPLVCFNGVWIGERDGTAFQSHPLPQQAVDEIFAITDQLPGSTCIYPTTEQWWMNRTCAVTEDWADRYQVDISIGGSRPQADSFKVMYVSEPALLAAVLPKLRQQLGEKYHVVASKPTALKFISHMPPKLLALSNSPRNWTSLESKSGQ